MNEKYGFEVSSADVSVALDCEADRARSDGMSNTAERQQAAALHLRNAAHHMTQFCPSGYRTRTRIVVDYVPAVNPVLRDDVRGRR